MGPSHNKRVATGLNREATAMDASAVPSNRGEIATPTAVATRPIAKLTTGPTMAMRNSALGEGGSASIWAMPPKTKSVIRGMGMP